METGFHKWIIGRKVEQAYYNGDKEVSEGVNLDIMDRMDVIVNVSWTHRVKHATRFDSPEQAATVLQALRNMNICLKTCQVMRIKVIFKEIEDDNSWVI